MDDHDVSNITLNFVLKELCTKVSAFNANLLMQSAKKNCGIDIEMDEKLKIEHAKAICLELIKIGGPSFQVGKNIYTTLQ